MANDFNRIFSGKYLGTTITFHSVSNKTDAAYIARLGEDYINIDGQNVETVFIKGREEWTDTAKGVVDMAIGCSPTLAAIDASDHKNHVVIRWKDGTTSECYLTDSGYRTLQRLTTRVNSVKITKETLREENKGSFLIYVVIAIIWLILYIVGKG